MSVLVGVLIGLLAGRLLWTLVGLEPEYERIRKVLAACEKEGAEGLVALLAENALRIGTRMNDGYGYDVDGFWFYQKIGATEVRTPKRETVIELFQDVPKFRAQIEALRIAEERAK